MRTFCPYFRRAEGASIPDIDEDFHGRDGPLGVSRASANPLCDAYIAAAAQAGIPTNPDHNGREQEGARYFQVTTRNGWRSSAATAYLKPARKRPNLHVQTDTLVRRLIVDGTWITGVEVEHGGKVEILRAGREVLLAAGAINSPQILQISGIGNANTLRGHGVEVVHDLPEVGENLQDHYTCRSTYRCAQPVTVNDEVRSWPRKVRVALQWLRDRSGPMSLSAGQVGVFAKTRPECATPDGQFYFLRFSAQQRGRGLTHGPALPTPCVSCALKAVAMCGSHRPIIGRNLRSGRTIRTRPPTAKPWSWA